MIQQSYIRLNNLSTGYISGRHKKLVTAKLNADLYRGELTCLLGPNGMGKSTLLKTLCGFQQSITGNIIIDGVNLKDCNPHKLSRIVSVVLTERPSIPNISVYEVVGMGRSPYTGFLGKLTTDDKVVVADCINKTGINNLRERQWLSLSDGEKQKVMIAKALAQQTPVIFLDEPTAFLDLPSKVEIMHLLHKLAREHNKLIFLSTHDMELALQMADKIWVLAGEETLWTGSPEDLLMNRDFTRFFERDGIRFDYKTGLFRIKNDIKNNIHLIGKGFEYGLIETALMRSGIGVDGGDRSEYVVEIEHEDVTRFSFRKGDELLSKSDSVEEITRAVIGTLNR
jgi:iron complex transport system ATP-binding protein